MKIKKKIAQLRYKYKISITNDETFESLFSIKLSKLNLFSLITSFTILITILIILLIAFTNLKQFIPGYDQNLRQNIINNSIYIDSLKMELQKRDRFFESINRIVNDKVKLEIIPENNIDTTNNNLYNIDFETTAEESKFRSVIEEQERFNLLLSDKEKISNTEYKFFPPIKGLISQQFDAMNNHFGIDIVAKQDTKISTVLDGTVIFTGWTVKTGYVISIQHSNNLLSTYKHNSVLLKKVGEHVKAGEAIAILGNTGELTSSTHLHFELWKEGKALNPELFIKF